MLLTDKSTNTDRSELPVAVFDSGVGGISVLRELRTLMPNEDYVYFGDCLNAPYGTKSVSEIERLTLDAAKYLVSKNIKCLTVACNTATAVCISRLREIYTDIPVIGVEPALKPAVKSNPHGNIVVMATPVTLRQEKFIHLLNKYGENSKAKIIMLPCPGLVELIESGKTEGECIESRIKELFAPFDISKLDAVVLGCTHYPFVKKSISCVLGDKAALFDGGEGTAREAHRKLSEYGLLRKSPYASGKVTFINSDASKGTDFMKKLCFEL